MRSYIAVTLVLAWAVQAHAIEPYRAQDLQPHAASGIEPYRSSQIEPYRSSQIEPYRSTEIQPYRSTEIQPSRSTEIQPYRAGQIEPDRAQQPGSQRADQVRPSPPQAVKQQPSALPEPQRTPAPVRQAERPSAAAGRPGAGVQTVLGIWQTNIPGAVYTTPSGIAGYDTLHVSSGAAAGLLRINADGSYYWNSYGGKKGKWVKSRDPEYPVEIIDTVENRRWKVGYSPAKKSLLIWSGSFWYEGRKAALKKKAD